MLNKDIIIENLQEEVYDLESKIEELELKLSDYEDMKKTYYKTRCFYCGSPLIWGSDFSFEDYGLDGEGIVSSHSCSNCPVTVEFYCPIGE